MNTKLQPGHIVAMIALSSLLVLSMDLSLQPTSKAHAASTTNSDYLAYATAGAQALQGWYNTSNGVFNTAGWWNSANALNALIDYERLSGNTSYLGDIATTYNQNSSSNFLNDYYDDEGWWGLTWVNAYDYTGNVIYLNMAKTIFNDMSGGWDSTCNGGIWWSKDRTYKNAIPNELFLELAARLHERTPGDSGSGSYLDWANREWTWFSGSGMINSSHLINDGLNSSCQNNGQTAWTYNQGVILGGLTEMYTITADTSYLSQAESIASAATGALSTANSVLKEPNEPCGTSCGGDGPQFKGIFIRNLSYLYRADHQQSYENFILTNANSIWQNDQNNASQFGMMWYGPFDSADAARQSSALDTLNAAIQFDSVSISSSTYYNLINTNSGLLLDIAGSSTAAGALAVQSTSSGATSQQWKLVAAGSSYYMLMNRNSGDVLDVTGSSTTAGARLEQGNNSSSANQQWQLAGTSNGSYTIRNRSSGLLTDVTGASTASGAAVIQWSADGGINQQWKLVVVPTFGVTYELLNRNSGKVIDVSGASTTDGGVIIQYTDHDNANQQWTLADAGGGYITITNVNSRLALDVPRASTAQGTQLDQWGGNGGANQQWQFVSQGGGFYTLVSRNSGELVDVNGDSTQDSASVIQWVATGGTNQQWQLLPVS